MVESMQNLIKAFLFGGLICGVSELACNRFKLMPIHITCALVVAGGVLEFYGLYDKLIDFANCGATIPISSFGHSVVHSAIETAYEVGYIGVFEGVLKKVSPGIVICITISFMLSLIFKPKS